MISAILDKPLDLLENLVVSLEQYEENEKRPQVFSRKGQHSDEQEAESKKNEDGADSKSDDVNESDKKEQARSERFKDLSFELLDIGLYHGQRGLNYLKQTPVYTLTDKYVHYEERYENVKGGSIKVYKYVNESVQSTKENLYIVYDQANNYYSFMVKVLRENQSKVTEYVKEHYDNVTIRIQDNWMKLDFNNDGKVSFEDLKKGVSELYEFLINYDYITKATEIKNTLYEEALRYMRSDVHKRHEENHKKDEKKSDDSTTAEEKKEEESSSTEKKEEETTTTSTSESKTENDKTTTESNNNSTTTTTTQNKKKKGGAKQE